MEVLLNKKEFKEKFEIHFSSLLEAGNNKAEAAAKALILAREALSKKNEQLPVETYTLDSFKMLMDTSRTSADYVAVDIL